MNLRSLNEKWHGLPKWAWAAIVAGGMFLLYYLYKKRAASSANATPASAGSPSDTTGDGTGNDGGGGGGGFVPPPTPPGEVVPEQPTTGTTVPTELPVTAPPTVVPTTGQTTSPTKVAATASKSVLVPLHATATSLQTTVIKPTAKGIYVPKTAAQKAALNHPSAVKITANKTGGSANRTQGIFAIH